MKTDPTDSDPTFSAGRKLLAWGVHIFTASGVVMGLLALVAVVNRNWRGALLWLFVAVLIDTVDGALARKISHAAAQRRCLSVLSLRRCAAA